MKLVYKDMNHIIKLGEGCVAELIIENRKFFFEVIKSLAEQAAGGNGNAVLSIADKPVEFSKWADITVQFAPFQINRKSLLTKLQASLERNALQAEKHSETYKLLNSLEAYIHSLAEDMPFEINCQKVAIGSIIKAISPEIEESEMSTIEKIFSYMEFVRELDRDRLFIMVNMRLYFSDEEMDRFIESVCLHDFKLLLLEGFAQRAMKNTTRYIVDEDLCEF